MSTPCRTGRFPGIAALLVFCLTIAACQTAPRSGPGPLTLASADGALPTMERIGLAASRCWFRSDDPLFAPYRLAPELNSFSGRPRILLVARDRPEALPLAVVVASGSPASVEVFGPLMDASTGVRIAADIKRWSAGSADCAAQA